MDTHFNIGKEVYNFAKPTFVKFGASKSLWKNIF